MEENDFDATLQKLSEQVNHFVSTSNINVPDVPKISGSNITSSCKVLFSKINFKSPFFYYGSIPLGIMIVLLIWKPKFVTEEISVDGNIPEHKLIFKKLIIATIIFTAIIAIIIFIKSYNSINNDST